MSDMRWMPPPEKDEKAARRQFVELYGSTAVMNTYLKIAVVALCVVILGQTALEVKTLAMVRNFKPWIIRIDEVGKAEAVTYGSLEYHPQESELKYFLIQFVTDHYSRMRRTIRDSYPRSLYFLDGRLADALIQAGKKNKTVETFLAGGGDEIDISIQNVSLEDLRQPPYRATVDFDKVYYSAADHAVVKREKYVANFVFIIKDHVPNAMIPVNPLGLTITYFREDQAFQ
jgi:type IV secretory pathway TrbF-like protein